MIQFTWIRVVRTMAGLAVANVALHWICDDSWALVAEHTYFQLIGIVAYYWVVEGAAMLSELDANEFFDVYRVFRPDATRDEFDREWALFQQFKAAYQKRRSAQ